MDRSEQSSLPGRALLRIIVIGVAVVVVVGGVLWLVQRTPEQGNNENATTTARETVNTAPPFDTRFGAPPADADQDGLTNDEETALGTNPTDPDTDRDNLTDYDEGRLYRSDPLKSDSDGDGNPDGAEVQKGFSPTGPGKLFEPNPALINTTP